MTNQIIETDVLIIGGGIAGLYAGIETIRQGQKVVILVKGPTCSTGIVGFNVAFPKLSSGDSPAQFFDDLIMGGRHLNDKSLIAIMAYESTYILNELEKMGIKFQKINDEFAVRRAAGSSVPRTVYFGDSIGPDIMSCFLKYLNDKGAKFLKNTSMISLIKEGPKVVGASAVSEKGQLTFINSKATVLATGGAGNLYSFCTTPKSIDGDGYRVAFEVGAKLMDMEFVQFEPFIITSPPQLKGVGIPTTSIWDGAKLYNINKEEFLPKDSKSKVLNLTKDVLSRLIRSEISSGRGTKEGGVYMDWTVLPDEIISKYPRFVKICQSGGVDPYKTPMEVAPACHHMMGGVIIDDFCRSTVDGLFAAGEVASGVHGANRLAGAAGTDVLVFGKRAGKYAAIFAKKNRLLSSESFGKLVNNHMDEFKRLIGERKEEEISFEDMLSDIRSIMWNKVGIIRNANDLEHTIDHLTALNNSINRSKISNFESLEMCFKLKSACLVSLMIAKAALLRQESRGDHYREDHSERDDLNWLKHIVFSTSNIGELETSYEGLEAQQQAQSWGALEGNKLVYTKAC